MMNARRLLRVLLALFAIGCFLWLGRQYLHELPKVLEASIYGVASIAAVHLLTLWVQGLTLQWGMDSFDKSVSERESFALTVVSSYANLLLPRSGVGTTALYLNRVHKSSLIDYSSVVAINAILFLLASSAIGCVVFGIMWMVGQPIPNLALAIALPAIVAGCLIGLKIDWRFVDRYRGPFHSIFKKLSHARAQMCDEQIWRIGLVHFVMVFLRAFRLHIAFWAMGFEVSFLAVLLTSTFSDLAFVIAVTPGALGFRETAIAFAAAGMGLPVSAALSVAILDRLVFSSTVIVAAQVVLATGFTKDLSASGNPAVSTPGIR